MRRINVCTEKSPAPNDIVYARALRGPRNAGGGVVSLPTHDITQYGSTVYIGIAMGGPAL